MGFRAQKALEELAAVRASADAEMASEQAAHEATKEQLETSHAENKAITEQVCVAPMCTSVGRCAGSGSSVDTWIDFAPNVARHSLHPLPCNHTDELWQQTFCTIAPFRIGNRKEESGPMWESYRRHHRAMCACMQLDSLKQAMRQLADEKDASVELAVKPLHEKLAAQQQELGSTAAALKAAQAVGASMDCPLWEINSELAILSL